MIFVEIAFFCIFLFFFLQFISASHWDFEIELNQQLAEKFNLPHIYIFLLLSLYIYMYICTPTILYLNQCVLSNYTTYLGPELLISTFKSETTQYF